MKTCNNCIHTKICPTAPNAYSSISPRLNLLFGSHQPIYTELEALIAKHCKYYLGQLEIKEEK